MKDWSEMSERERFKNTYRPFHNDNSAVWFVSIFAVAVIGSAYFIYNIFS